MVRNAGQAEKEMSVETRRRIVDEICYNLTIKQESTRQHCSKSTCCVGNWLAGYNKVEML